MIDIKLSFVVAMASNRVIGRDNGLPWRLPEDLKYFKQVTMGRPMIMGRKTFDSIGRPLPGRTNIVVTRQREWQAPGVAVAESLDHALRLARRQAETDCVPEVMLIGGADLFDQALPLCDRLYLTEVHADVQGDTFFPQLSISDWRETQRQDRPAENDQSSNGYDYSFVVLDRVREDLPSNER